MKENDTTEASPDQAERLFTLWFGARCQPGHSRGQPGQGGHYPADCGGPAAQETDAWEEFSAL